MRFNAAKCNIMRVSRMRLPFLYSYKLSGQVLDEVKDSKYLGVTISDNLDWSKHITTTTTKANARLSFIKRNLKDCPQKLKEIAYFSLVRSFVDYASAVWDPHQKFNQVKLEMVQRRAARFVKSRYKRTDSVTAMLDELGWPILSKKRKDARLILFYKIINNLAQVPHELDGRQCGNNLALCNFAVVMELPDSLYMNWKSEFGVIFLRCSPR